MFPKITSTTNPKIKDLVRLQDRRQRDKTGLTLVEGLRELTLAIEAKTQIQEIFVTASFLEKKSFRDFFKKLKVPVYEASDAVYAKMSYGDRNDGVIAALKPSQNAFANLKNTKGLYLIVEKVEKPGNLGAILRSADASGTDGVIICDGKTDLYNPNVIRSSLGTIFSVRTVVGSNQAAVNFCKAKGIKICAASPNAAMVYTQANFMQPVAIVVGSEQDGLSDFWITHADMKVKIPMLGKIDSLNVSASTAILLYEVIRQRTLK